MKKVFVLLTLLSILFNVSVADACTFTIDCTHYSALNAAARSALMPGWGQGWNGQKTKGWIVFGIFAASVTGCILFNREAENNYSDYEETGAKNSSKYDDYKDNLNISRILGGVALATWIFAVADAYFVGKSREEMYVRKHFDIQMCSNDGVMLKYRTKFSI